MTTQEETCQGKQFVVPAGLKCLLEEMSREVLRSQPANIYSFLADYLEEKCRKQCGPECGKDGGSGGVGGGGTLPRNTDGDGGAKTGTTQGNSQKFDEAAPFGYGPNGQPINGPSRNAPFGYGPDGKALTAFDPRAPNGYGPDGKPLPGAACVAPYGYNKDGNPLKTPDPYAPFGYHLLDGLPVATNDPTAPFGFGLDGSPLATRDPNAPLGYDLDGRPNTYPETVAICGDKDFMGDQNMGYEQSAPGPQQGFGEALPPPQGFSGPDPTQGFQGPPSYPAQETGATLQVAQQAPGETMQTSQRDNGDDETGMLETDKGITPPQDGLQGNMSVNQLAGGENLSAAAPANTENIPYAQAEPTGNETAMQSAPDPQQGFGEALPPPQGFSGPDPTQGSQGPPSYPAQETGATLPVAQQAPGEAMQNAQPDNGGGGTGMLETVKSITPPQDGLEGNMSVSQTARGENLSATPPDNTGNIQRAQTAPTGPVMQPGYPGNGPAMQPGYPGNGPPMQPGIPINGPPMQPGYPGNGPAMQPGNGPAMQPGIPVNGPPMQPGYPGNGPAMQPGNGPAMQPGIPVNGPPMQPGYPGNGPPMQPGIPVNGPPMQPGYPGNGPPMQPGIPGNGPPMQPGIPGNGPAMQPGIPGNGPAMQPINPGNGPSMQAGYPGSIQTAQSGFPESVPGASPGNDGSAPAMPQGVEINGPVPQQGTGTYMQVAQGDFPGGAQVAEQGFVGTMPNAQQGYEAGIPTGQPGYGVGVPVLDQGFVGTQPSGQEGFIGNVQGPEQGMAGAPMGYGGQIGPDGQPLPGYNEPFMGDGQPIEGYGQPPYGAPQFYPGYEQPYPGDGQPYAGDGNPNFAQSSQGLVPEAGQGMQPGVADAAPQDASGRTQSTNQCDPNVMFFNGPGTKILMCYNPACVNPEATINHMANAASCGMEIGGQIGVVDGATLMRSAMESMLSRVTALLMGLVSQGIDSNAAPAAGNRIGLTDYVTNPCFDPRQLGQNQQQQQQRPEETKTGTTIIANQQTNSMDDVIPAESNQEEGMITSQENAQSEIPDGSEVQAGTAGVADSNEQTSPDDVTAENEAPAEGSPENVEGPTEDSSALAQELTALPQASTAGSTTATATEATQPASDSESLPQDLVPVADALSKTAAQAPGPEMASENLSSELPTDVTVPPAQTQSTEPQQAPQGVPETMVAAADGAPQTASATVPQQIPQGVPQAEPSGMSPAGQTITPPLPQQVSQGVPQPVASAPTGYSPISPATIPQQATVGQAFSSVPVSAQMAQGIPQVMAASPGAAPPAQALPPGMVPPSGATTAGQVFGPGMMPQGGPQLMAPPGQPVPAGMMPEQTQQGMPSAPISVPMAQEAPQVMAASPGVAPQAQALPPGMMQPGAPQGMVPTAGQAFGPGMMPQDGPQLTAPPEEPLPAGQMPQQVPQGMPETIAAPNGLIQAGPPSGPVMMTGQLQQGVLPMMGSGNEPQGVPQPVVVGDGTSAQVYAPAMMPQQGPQQTAMMPAMTIPSNGRPRRRCIPKELLQYIPVTGGGVCTDGAGRLDAGRNSGAPANSRQAALAKLKVGRECTQGSMTDYVEDILTRANSIIVATKKYCGGGSAPNDVIPDVSDGLGDQLGNGPPVICGNGGLEEPVGPGSMGKYLKGMAPQYQQMFARVLSPEDQTTLTLLTTVGTLLDTIEDTGLTRMDPVQLCSDNTLKELADVGEKMMLGLKDHLVKVKSTPPENLNSSDPFMAQITREAYEALEIGAESLEVAVGLLRDVTSLCDELTDHPELLEQCAADLEAARKKQDEQFKEIACKQEEACKLAMNQQGGTKDENVTTQSDPATENKDENVTTESDPAAENKDDGTSPDAADMLDKGLLADGEEATEFGNQGINSENLSTGQTSGIDDPNVGVDGSGEAGAIATGAEAGTTGSGAGIGETGAAAGTVGSGEASKAIGSDSRPGSSSGRGGTEYQGKGGSQMTLVHNLLSAQTTGRRVVIFTVSFVFGVVVGYALCRHFGLDIGRFLRRYLSTERYLCDCPSTDTAYSCSDLVYTSAPIDFASSSGNCPDPSNGCGGSSDGCNS